MSSKKYNKILEVINSDVNEEASFDKIIDILQNNSSLNFDPSVEVVFNLGVDAKNTDQTVRGVIALPKGLGRKIKIGVFVTEAELKMASESGADEFGSKDYIDSIIKGDIKCDIYYASAAAVPLVAKAAKVLGPKKLMPSLKSGTVFQDVNELKGLIEIAKKGQLQFKTAKDPIVHAIIGKLSFSVNDLKENFKVLFEALKNARPTSVKMHSYIKSVYISTTMSPSVKLNLKETV